MIAEGGQGAPARIIRIRCKGSANYSMDDLSPFQGDMKTLPDEDLGKLRASIIEHGFSFPFFIWRTKAKLNIIDGHQRLKVLSVLRDMEGWVVPKLPCIEVQARTKLEAKRKLLAAASQYGKFNKDGLEDFLRGVGSLSFIKLPGLDLDDLPEVSPEIIPGDHGYDPEDEEKEKLRPFKQVHVLLSFSPDVFLEIKNLLDQIIKIEGVEYEQSAN